MARESYLQNGGQFSFRIHHVEQAFRNLFRAAPARFGTLGIGDPLGNVVACGVIQFVIPAAKQAIFAENALELIGDGYGPFFAVEFHLETGNAAFDGSRSLLHSLVDQQNVPTLSGRKQRSTEREPVDFAFHFDLATRPPDFGCIERHVDNDPIEAGTHAFKPGLEALRGGRGLGFRGFRHGRKPGVCILI